MPILSLTHARAHTHTTHAHSFTSSLLHTRNSHTHSNTPTQTQYVQILAPSAWSASLDLESDMEGFRLANVVRLQRLLRKHLVLRRFWKTVRQYKDSDLSKESPKRRHALLEIYTTELTYYTSLETLRTHYMQPLVDFVEQPAYGHTKADIAVLFSNMDSLQQMSKQALEVWERLKTENDFSEVGPYFVRMAPVLKLYAEYVNNFDHAMERLQELMKNPQFVNLLSTCKQRSRSSLDLGAYLIQPVQRLPRYEILLREVIKHTHKEHPDYTGLVKAKTAVKEVNTYINQRKRTLDGRTKLMHLQRSVKRCPNITAAHRFHVRDAVLQVSSTRRNHSGSFHMFLFNDMLLACKTKSGGFMGLFSEKSLDFAFLLSLAEVELRDAPNKSMFRLTSGDLQNMQRTIYTFLIPTSVSSSEWIKDLHEFVKKASAAPAAARLLASAAH
jgi:RhoGEF domain/SOS1/NGEF-like PH domain